MGKSLLIREEGKRRVEGRRGKRRLDWSKTVFDTSLGTVSRVARLELG